MTTAAVSKKHTYDDYRKLPEGSPCQLIGGELVMTPSPLPYHQDISRNIEFKLLKHVVEKKLGKVYDAPIDVYLEEEETYQPDLIFISNQRLRIIEKERINGAPDVVFEILSPSNAYYDMRKKFRKYEQHDVREYWIVDPEEKSVEVYINETKSFKMTQRVVGQAKVHSTVIEGFEMDLEEIFRA
jgi:Uma2 family endonuclease